MWMTIRQKWSLKIGNMVRDPGNPTAQTVLNTELDLRKF